MQYLSCSTKVLFVPRINDMLSLYGIAIINKQINQSYA